ncbi:MAG: PD-(D/E)XK nuclease family protein, partial [Treponema sp.]|nr:PD-(D/E)XK nuclease family protein [Treponema sp.]
FLSGCLGLGDDEEDEGAGDFSLKIKRYVNERAQKMDKANPERDPAIFDDNTFFGLCLPALASRMGNEDGNPDELFFEIEQIPGRSGERIGAGDKGSRFSNDEKGLNDFIAATSAVYAGVQGLSAPSVPQKRVVATFLSDSSSGAEGEEIKASAEFSGADSADIFSLVDEALNRVAKKSPGKGARFDQAGFGSLAHVCVEAHLCGKKADLPPELAGHLNAEDSHTFLDLGRELATRFAASPLGITAGRCENRKSEFPFRSLARATGDDFFFINGIIDLLFDDEGAVYVVDLKTDAKENPFRHLAQIAAYWKAASDLFAAPAEKKCRAFLYYLRSGHAVEMTTQAERFDLGAARPGLED